MSPLKKSSLLVALALSTPALAKSASDYHIPVPKGVPAGFEALAERQGYYDIFVNGDYVSTAVTKHELHKENKLALATFVFEHLSKFDEKRYINEMTSSDNIEVFASSATRRIDVVFEKKRAQRLSAPLSWQTSIETNQLASLSNGESSGNTMLRSIVSKGQHAVQSNIFEREGKVKLTSLSYSHEMGEDRLTYGLFTPSYTGYTRLYGQSIQGVQYKKRALLHESFSKRRPIELLLTDAALVTILKNNTPLKSVTLNAGEHSITSDDLPPGNYEITLNIKYYNGQEDSINASVSSSSHLSSSDGWDGIVAGKKRSNRAFFDSDSDESFFISSMYAKTLLPSVQAQFNIAYDKGVLFNPTLRHRTQLFNNRFSLTVGPDYKEQFFDLMYQTSDHRFKMQYLHRDVADTDIDSIDGLPEKIKRATTSYAYSSSSWGSFNVSAQYNFINKANYLSLSHAIPILSHKKHNVMLTTTLRKGNEVFWGVNISYRLNPQNSDYAMSSALELGEESQFRQAFYQQKRWQEWGVSSQAGIVSAERATSGFIHSNISNNNYGHGSFGLTHIDNNQNDATYINANASVKFSGDMKGAYVVGRQKAETGMILDLSNEAPDSKYELNVNNRKSVYRGAESHFIPLSPHVDYTASLINKSSAKQRVENKTHRVHLHRYNVYVPKWETTEVELLFGRLFVDGKLTTDAQVNSSVSQGFSDGNGFFLIEIEGATLSINGKSCVIKDKSTHDIKVSCKQSKKGN